MRNLPTQRAFVHNNNDRPAAASRALFYSLLTTIKIRPYETVQVYHLVQGICIFNCYELCVSV